MICPNCKESTFHSVKLDGVLDAKECSGCSGVWIPGYNYAKYLENPPQGGYTQTYSMQNVRGYDSEQGKICPDCGKAVVARKVGAGLDFFVERCDNCFGIFLDQGEWEALRENNLVAKINYIFSAYWQAKVLRENSQDYRRQEINKLLGPARASVVLEFMDWLDVQPEKRDITRYLG